MKYFSDKGTPRMRPCFSEEFADDFFEIEEAYARTELAGGPISRRIIESRDDMSVVEKSSL